MNRVENTKTIEGFRVFKEDAFEVENYFKNFSYGWMDRDGNHWRPFLAKPSKEEKYSIDIIVLEVEADGIVIKSWTHNRTPQLTTITADYKELLKEWLTNKKETWIINE